MARRATDRQFNFRVSEDMHAALTAQARLNHRSLNAEITFRLQQSLQPDLLKVPFGPQQPGWPNRDEERMDRMAGNS